MLRSLACLCLALTTLGSTSVARAAATAELIHFTEDGSAEGKPLLPGFKHHSIWSGIGAGSNGKIYIAVSNHAQPGGNVAVFAYSPEARAMALLGDLRSVSQRVDNWMEQESQYKVHTFLLEHADGKLYFATDDHEPTPFLRGSHVYQIDPTSNELRDYSKTQPFLLSRDLWLRPNPGQAAEGSGVFVEYYGIKGLGLNRAVPHLLYAMTYPDGHIIRHDLRNGDMRPIGRSEQVSYVFYVDRKANLYYAATENDENRLVKYSRATGQTRTIARGLPPGELGAVAPNADGSRVYVLHAHRRTIYLLEPEKDRFMYWTKPCGSNWWRLYNLTLSPDGRTLYFVSNNNKHRTVRQIDVATKRCSVLLDVHELLGSRNLSFGGINVWDRQGSFYTPVWTFNSETPDAAVLKVTVGR